MEKSSRKKLFARLGCFLCLFVVLCSLVLNIDFQIASASAISEYPMYMPLQNFAMTFYLGGDLDSSYYVPLPSPYRVNSGSELDIVDEVGTQIGTVSFSFSDGMLTYSISLPESISSLTISSDSLALFAPGDYYILQLSAPFVFSADSWFEYFALSRDVSSSDVSQSAQMYLQEVSHSDVPVGSAAGVRFQPVYNAVVTYFNMVVDFPSPVDSFEISVPGGLITDYSDSYYDDIVSNWDYSERIVYQELNTDFPSDWTGWLADAVGGFFDFEIAPNFSFGDLFITVIGILLFVFFISVFKG